MSEKNLTDSLHNSSERDKAFRCLVDTYKEQLYWQIRRMVSTHEDTDDILQNTFIKAWTAIDSFRGDCKLSTWLYKIAYNETLNHLAHRRFTTSIDSPEENLANTLQQDPYFDGDETQAQFQEAISLLPNKQREVFNLKYFDEMKYEEMSEILDTSVGALKASYHHAVKKIIKFFEQHD